MKRLLVASLLAVPLLGGCIVSDGPQARKAEVFERCRMAPGPEARATCIKTETALAEARADKEVADFEAQRAADEARALENAKYGDPNE